MLEYTQILSLEVGATCNLDTLHKWCPVSVRPDGRKEMDDDKIASLAVEAYGLGFDGWVAFHFLNEPLLQPRRLSNIIDKVKEQVPTAKFLLWTNGNFFNEANKPVINKFEWVVVSDYFKKGIDHYAKYIDGPRLQVNPEVVDGRLEYGTDPTTQPCLRPFIEFIITSYGQALICCQDWKGKIEIGNVFDSSLKELNERRFELAKKLAKPMDESCPEVCRNCRGKMGLAFFDQKIVNKTFAYLDTIR